MGTILGPFEAISGLSSQWEPYMADFSSTPGAPPLSQLNAAQ